MVIACTRDCYDTCIFDSNYKPLKIFPFNGFTCSRGNDDLRRNGVNRVESAYFEGKEVSLDRAISLLAQKVKEIKERDPTKILQLSYDGSQGLLTWYYPSRLWNAMGATSTDYSICSAEGHNSIASRYGSSFGATPEEFEKYGAVVFWGSEAAVSFIHGWSLLKDKYKVAIDVRKGITASRSNEVYLVRPGGDLYLALWILKRLLDKGYGDGVEEVENLKSLTSSLDPTQVSQLTGLPLEDMESLVQLYEMKRPLTIIGFAMGRTFNGGDAVGMISLIPSVLGMKRGFFYANSQGLGIDFSYLRGNHMVKPRKIIGMAEVGSRIEEVELIFAWNINPVHSLPGSDRLMKAVKEGKVFLVVQDPFWSESVKLANLAIPAPTFLEKMDVVYSYWHTYLIYNSPIFPKKGMEEWELTHRLAKEMGFTHPLLEEGPEAAIDGALRRTGVTLDRLRRDGIVKLNPDPPYRPRVGPLPHLLPPPKGTVLVFSSHPLYTNSQFKEVHGVPEPVVWTRDTQGIGYLISKYGRVKVRFKADTSIPKGVVYMHKSCLMDLEGSPVNSLFGPEKGKYGGTPPLNAVEVTIQLLNSS